MGAVPTPKLSAELAERIRLVRRDVGSLLWHFTRSLEDAADLHYTLKSGSEVWVSPASADNVLRKILEEESLLGSKNWTYGFDCVCFTEAPIQEFNSIFGLVAIASSNDDRPRYEPYGVGVSKRWLFEQGGRPVIYDRPHVLDELPDRQKYRFAPYDPTAGIDFTWEREWRIQTSKLILDPRETLVVVPTADEAFGLAYEFAKVEADWDESGPTNPYHVARWQTVSLDLFGL